MKKLSFIIIILMSIVPSFIYADDDKKMDMGIYSNYAAYGFFLLLVLFFSFFLYFSNIIDPPAKLVMQNSSYPDSGSFGKGFQKDISVIYYAFVALILFAILSFFLLIH